MQLKRPYRRIRTRQLNAATCAAATLITRFCAGEPEVQPQLALRFGEMTLAGGFPEQAPGYDQYLTLLQRITRKGAK